MPCPTTIHVLGTEVPINLTSERDDVWGEWDGTEGSILLNDRAEGHKLRITFLHELIHGIDDLLGLNVKHHAVYALSQVLWATLVDNPELARWLVEPLTTHEEASRGGDRRPEY